MTLIIFCNTIMHDFKINIFQFGMVIMNDILLKKLIGRTETLRKMNEEMEENIERLQQTVIHNRNILNGIRSDYEISEAWLKKLKNLADDSVYKGAGR